MITIRLDRVGVRRKPVYRIVVVDHKVKKGGENLGILGLFQPGKNLKIIDKEKLSYWQSRGARVSASVKKILEK